MYVSSKWGYTYVADWKVELEEGAPHEVKDHSLEVRRQINIDDCFNIYQDALIKFYIDSTYLYIISYPHTKNNTIYNTICCRTS